MNSSLSYIITSFAPTAINAEFTEIKKRFNLFIDQQTGPNGVITKNTAHITVKSGFYLKENAIEENIVASLDKLLFRSFQVTANMLTIFKSEKHNNILVALVEKPPELQILHDSIYAALEMFVETNSIYEKSNYTPHMSLLYNLPEHQINESTNYIEKHILPISFMFDNFSVLKEISGVKGERELIKKYTIDKR